MIRVVYLPKPSLGDDDDASAEMIVSERLGPGVDPIAEARRRGTILAIVRLGSRQPAPVDPPAADRAASPRESR